MVKNRYALVFGGSDRIGRAVASHLFSQGYTIAVHYNTDEEHARETSMLCGNAPLIQGDLCDVKSIERVYEQVFSLFPSLDVVVNCAAVFHTESFTDTTIAEYDLNYHLHVRGGYFLTQQLYLKMKERGEKSVVIHFGDASASLQIPSRPSYALSKKALMDQIAPLASLCAPQVRVNAIAPGLILSNNPQEEAYFRKREEELPLKKLASLDDILLTLDFFIKNRSVTGQILRIDGGEWLL